MHSIGASWAVPTIAKGSRQGYAGTWIGAQATFGHSAFIQVGTNENKELFGTTVYYAFWTDTARQFHPVPLFPVEPHARMTASLRLAHGRWTVFIRDAGSGKEARFSTGEEADASFSLAEWLQEDPRIGSSVGPYPALEGVKFEKLSLNGAVPEYARLHSQWMTVNDENLGPSPLIHDSFLLNPVTLSAAGAHYLRIADEFNPHLDAFRAALNWKTAPDLAQLESARRALVIALTRNISELKTTTWPAASVGYVRALIERTQQLLASAENMPTSPQQLNAWRQTCNAIQQTIGVAGQAARRALGVPQLSPHAQQDNSHVR